MCAHVFQCACVPWRTNKKAAACETPKRQTEEKPSTLNNHSSLLAIYNVLHYITIPLTCRHLHIPVTSLQRLLIINGSHMLPGAPYYRIITATQKAKKNENYVDMKWSTKPIKGSAVIDSVSQSHWLNEYHLYPQVMLSCWQPSACWGLVFWVHFWDVFLPVRLTVQAVCLYVNYHNKMKIFLVLYTSTKREM